MRQTTRSSAIATLPSHRVKACYATRQILIGVGALLFGGSVLAQSINPNQQAAGAVLNNCFTIYDDLVSGESIDPSDVPPICSTSYTPESIQSITPDQIFSMGSMATRLNGGKVTQPADYFGLNQKQHLGGGSGDIEIPRLNFWSKVDSGFGSLSNTFNQPGFKFDNHNFVFGADYRLQDNWVAGGSFAYRHNNASFNAGRGETTNDSYTGALYTAYNITDEAHVEATASYGGFNYDTRRNITVNGQSSVAKASPDGGQYAFSWGGGYDFNFQALTVAPYVRGEYMNLDIDGYSESGSLYAVRFGKQSIESLTSTIGIQTAYAISFPWGVLIPQLRGEWHHQFKDGQRQIQTGFINDPLNQTFVMTSEGPSRDYYTVGGEVSSVFAGGVSAFLAYESLQGYSNVNSNRFMLGARLEF
ncbi:autotransporter outer membrane beta-barrel domain-containing protein [Methylomonas methanica]|uniref:Outer membrane autotransporter barrel domain protein n=1 Tax=Methylomonas methanica (strain DSM 25384 / MC09) TaxID=857087 RepID=G0A725_METMM|nr:autotransporter outer membrane beta-barrel domain-containing protein [Methylomonas methanica]AEG01819.1 outer membrane autotransporter barrel domain protein [Methylomonas methanica MC09]